jgi:hypothetical protein
VPTSTVELSITCKDLADMDTFSKSDPFCVVYMKESGGGPDKWVSLGKTETIMNTLNPAWQTKFEVSYKFESRQMLKFDVYDLDSDSARLEDHDFIGSCECSLGEIVSAQGRGLTRRVIGAGSTANNMKQSITIIAEEMLSSREALKLSLSGLKLDRKDWFGFGRSDPFITISKSGEYGTFTVVHRTEVIKYNINPNWRTFTLPLKTLCNGDHERVLKIQVDDWNMNGSHNHIGEFQTSVKALLEQGRGAKIPFINEKKQRKKSSYKNSGHLIINSIDLELHPTFLDFISGGTELSFTVAVDFTGSNGNPMEPTSLHYNDPTGNPNQYVTAIRSVGDIIQDYDSDKMFPALGFGARIPPDGRVSHEFFLNLTNDPYCAGIDGVLAAYYQALNGVQLYGPTNFAPVINHVANFARAFQHDPTNYFVLLIITDGIITDLDATKRAVIEASSLPLSIIIIGVGSEDFTAMDELDSDDELLSINGRTAQRDIVQFVEMQKFVSGYGSQARWNKEMLAREVLFEIPDQLVGYMKSKNFKPGKKNI